MKRKKIEKDKFQLEIAAKHSSRSESDPVLRFTPYAWAKLEWLCHHGDTEIGGFGIASIDDLLLIEDFITVNQSVSCVSVSFEDEAVADFFEEQVDAGLRPEQFARIWLHTHPGERPHPSITDEETFGRVFDHCQWAVMFVLAKQGKTYARLRFNLGPCGQIVIPVMTDYTQAFTGSDHDAWLQEYEANIKVEPLHLGTTDGVHSPIVLEQSVEETELLARTQELNSDELDDLFESEVWL